MTTIWWRSMQARGLREYWRKRKAGIVVDVKKQWFVWEKIRRIHPMQNFDFLTYISEFGDPAVPTPAGVKYENRNVELLAKRKQFSLSGKRVAERAISDPKWFAGYLDSIDSTTAEYFAVAAGVLAADLSKKSDSELAAIFRKIHDSYLRSHYSGLLALVTEFVDEFISNELKRLLGKKIALKRMDIDTGKAFALLSQPTKESVLIE
ncbi:MAG: hypothetical protein NTW59_03985 [Candidatus Diapherotrites archaeon]|nr:hypothetical protein [Candidatus Diapherotrites archaeon]